MVKGMLSPKDIRKDGLTKAKKLREREGILTPRKGMYVAVGYDLFPYMTVHEIGYAKRGVFGTIGNGMQFDYPMEKQYPYMLLSKKRGKQLSDMVDHIRSERKKIIRSIEAEYHHKLKTDLAKHGFKHPKKGFK